MSRGRKLVLIQLRLPADAKEFIAAEAEKNVSSQNSEIIRCIREKMERIAKEKGEATAS